MKGTRLLLACAAVSAASACRTGELVLDETPADCGPGTICTVGPADPLAGDALERTVGEPTGMSVDPDGNVYLADPAHARIRRMNVDGTLEVIAGTGTSAPTRTGLPPLDTDLWNPTTVAACPDGWIFFASWGRDGRIYGIDPALEIVVDVASGFPLDYAEHLHCDSGSNLWVTYGYYGRVQVWNRGTSDLALSTVTVPAGQWRVAAGCGCSTNGSDGVAQSVTLIAPKMAFPREDGSGQFFVIHNNRVALTYSTGLLGTIAGGTSGNGGDGGAASGSSFYYVSGAALEGDLLFVSGNERLRAINLGTQPSTYAGATIAPGAIAGIAGTIGSTAFFGDGSAALQQELGIPYGVPVVDAQGGVLVNDSMNGLLRRVDPTSGTMRVVAGLTGGDDPALHLPAPTDVAVGPDGRPIVTTRGVHLVALSSSGAREAIAGASSPEYTGDGGPATSAGLWAAAGLVVTPDGEVIFSDTRNHVIRKIATDGTISTIAGNGTSVDGGAGDGGPAVGASFEGPGSLALDTAGNLFIVDHTKIRVVNRGSTSLAVAGVAIPPAGIDRIAGAANSDAYGGDGGPALAASFGTHYSEPSGIAVWNGGLYVADSHNQRIRRIDLTSGIVQTVVGNGAYGRDGDGGRPGDARIGEAVGLAIHDGWLYWSQLEGNVIRKVDLVLGTAGTVLPVAGNGLSGSGGDGGPALDASLYAPMEIDVAEDGRVYVVDRAHRLRVVRPE